MPSKKKSSAAKDQFDFKFKKDEKVLILPVNTGDDIYEAKVLECKMNGKSRKPQYKIHYKGWNKRWDEWVDHGRLLKINASNLQIMAEKKSQNRENQLRQQQLHQQQQSKDISSLQSASTSDTAGKKRKYRGSTTTKEGVSPSRSLKRRRMNEEEEKQKDPGRGPSDTLNAPLEIKLPNNLKRKLIADWESITKKNLVISLPRTSGHRVCSILRDFEQFAERNGQDKDIVTEITRGIKDYFNQALQVTLLYKLERNQLQSITAKHKDLSMDQIYGVEHLCRLFVKLPQLLSPSDLDEDTRRILKLQIEFMLSFVLEKEEYWSTKYVSMDR